jgi:hypothetical protein
LELFDEFRVGIRRLDEVVEAGAETGRVGIHGADAVAAG